MIASSPTVSAQDNAAAVPVGTKQDQHNPFSFSPPEWNNFKETIPSSLHSPGKIKRRPLWPKNRETFTLAFAKYYAQLKLTRKATDRQRMWIEEKRLAILQNGALKQYVKDTCSQTTDEETACVEPSRAPLS